jgi:hypothetical protein
MLKGQCHMAVTARYANTVDLKPGHSKLRQTMPAVAYRATPLGISRCDGRDMPMVAPTVARSATVGKLEVES